MAKKLTREARSAILSARAKNRKAAVALTAGDVTVPKAVAAHMKAIEDWANKALKVKATKVSEADIDDDTTVVDPSETHDSEAVAA